MKVTIGNVTFETDPNDSPEIQERYLRLFMESMKDIEQPKILPAAPIQVAPWVVPAPYFPGWPYGPQVWCMNAASSENRGDNGSI